eukprot:TRINITY_DN5830_c0_g1_i5.p1 TRINITY_DN5830_c0_g1~~TRINITY_DN5830_c0_g1_i5.p1  ORF type:complete len:409 (+),score=98.55 TRINITY_DN5830_c0_g1_i5:206-1432(+)
MWRIVKLLETSDKTILKFVTGIIEAISTHSVNKLALYSTGGVEALANLMHHPDPTIRRHVCGALINLAAQDKTHHRILKQMRQAIVLSFQDLVLFVHDQGQSCIVLNHQQLEDDYLEMKAENDTLKELLNDQKTREHQLNSELENLRKELLRVRGEMKQVPLLHISLDEIEEMTLIAQGLRTDVYCAKYRGKEIAIKKIRESPSNENLGQAVHREAHALSCLRHPNLVMLIGISTSSDALILEFMENGSLYSVLHEKKKKFTLKDKIHIANDVALGMNFLHKSSPKFIHQNLKSHNVLLDGVMRAKITDFGFYKLTDEVCGISENIGTLQWTAPEILEGSCYNEAVDVYSYGFILWGSSGINAEYGTKGCEEWGETDERRKNRGRMKGGREFVGGNRRKRRKKANNNC